MKKIIALIGLMGVGKSTLGLKLANSLNYYFIDSDQEIEDREKKSINDIFAQNGEKYFREAERKLIEEITSRDENIIISLGGGAFINEASREILQQRALIIWINASVNVILQRIGNKANRPLLNQTDKRKTLEDLARKRFPIYSQSDLKFNTGEESHEVIIQKIKKYLKNEK
jgi:shikimate kinase